jgi:hypothetical protein
MLIKRLRIDVMSLERLCLHYLHGKVYVGVVPYRSHSTSVTYSELGLSGLQANLRLTNTEASFYLYSMELPTAVLEVKAKVETQFV